MQIRMTVALWNREEDGSYQAEKDGWKLHVQWVPEPPQGGAFGYSWKAEKEEGGSQASTELVEEPEMAMMLAEHAAAGIKHPEH